MQRETVTGETVLSVTGRRETGPVKMCAMTKLCPINLLPDSPAVFECSASSVPCRAAAVTTTPSDEVSPSTDPCLDTDRRLDH